MAKYKKCDRCELNYIPVEEDYCKVCKQEMKLEKADETEDLEICPVCGVNYMSSNQTTCDDCSKKKSDADELNEETDDEPFVQDWTEDSMAADSDIEIISLSELEDEEDDTDDSFDDDEDGEFGKMGDESPVDDFDYVNPDDFDDDYEEDDDDDDDDEDDEYEEDDD